MNEFQSWDTAPGIISLMYASLNPEKVEKLILLATPVDFSKWYGSEDTLEDCYQRNFINNKMRIDSQIVDLGKIRCPLLNILATYDHIVPLSSGKTLKDVYSGKSYEEIVFPSSHVGLSVSKEAHLKLWPKVCEWVLRTE